MEKKVEWQKAELKNEFAFKTAQNNPHGKYELHTFSGGEKLLRETLEWAMAYFMSRRASKVTYDPKKPYCLTVVF